MDMTKTMDRTVQMMRMGEETMRIILVNVEEIKMILEQQNTGHDLAKGSMARQTQSPANLEGLGLPLPMNNWSH